MDRYSLADWQRWLLGKAPCGNLRACVECGATVANDDSRPAYGICRGERFVPAALSPAG